MVSYKNYDIQTNTADFVADTEAERDNWPTTAASGSAELFRGHHHIGDTYSYT